MAIGAAAEAIAAGSAQFFSSLLVWRSASSPETQPHPLGCLAVWLSGWLS
jgi:hypothetical protein